MNKFLPKSLKNPQGFTLVELMVAIAILAILSVAGLIIYSGAQKNARDARRREDIAAIANALESNKDNTGPSYTVLYDTYFTVGTVPSDSSRPYCAKWDTTSPSLISMTSAEKTSWNTTPTACPTGWTTVAALTAPVTATKAWTVCTILENGTSPNNVFCRSHSQ